MHILKKKYIFLIVIIFPFFLNHCPQIGINYGQSFKLTLKKSEPQVNSLGVFKKSACGLGEFGQSQVLWLSQESTHQVCKSAHLDSVFFFLHSLLPKSLAMSLLCNTAFAVQLSSSSLPDFLCPFACPFQLFAFLPCPFCSGCLSCACLLLKHLLVFIIDTVNLCFYLNFLPLSHASGFYYKPL